MVCLFVVRLVAALSVPAQASSSAVVMHAADHALDRVLEDAAPSSVTVVRGSDKADDLCPRTSEILDQSSGPFDVKALGICLVGPRPRQPTEHGSTRLLFMATGRTQARGEAEMGLYAGGMPFMQVGITGRVSIGAGLTFIWPGDEHPFWIAPKVQLFAVKNMSAYSGPS